MKYLNNLINFIKDNEDWQFKLKHSPYNLKSIKECSWHPNWWMFVYNLFESDLSNYVVRACRGTVLEINGKDIKVISYPYSKFDNYGSLTCKDIEDSINWNNAKFNNKIDGILIKTAKVDNKLYFFTNGSFDLNAPFEDSLVFDEEATRGAETYGDLLSYALSSSNVEINFNKKTGEFYCTGGWTEKIVEGSTIMFELTSPRNKILCEYKETKLWWHGYRNSSNIEINPELIKGLIPFDLVGNIEAKNLENLKDILKTFKGNEKEGVVVVDYSQVPVARCKIKCEDYLKLKFCRDNAANERVIFKAILDNEYDDLIANIPTIIPVVERIKSEIKSVIDWYDNLLSENKEMISTLSKKEWVIYCNSNYKKELFKYYMAIYDGFDITKRFLLKMSCQKNGYKDFKNLLCLI